MIYKSYELEKNFKLLKNNIVLFYGENSGLKDNFKNNIKKSEKKIEIVNFNQEDILKNQKLFFSELFNISLFSEKKNFFISQTNDKILDLIKEIEKKIETQKIFLFSELLEKKSKLRNYFEESSRLGIVPCYADNEISLKKMIMNKLKGYTGLSGQNLNIIINSCGLDRSKLNNELEKIVLFFENKIIDTNKLENLLNLRVNISFDLLKNHALVGDKANTNKLISDTVLENEKNIFYLNTINQRLMKLLEINEIAKNSDINDAISRIKPPIFWKDKAIFNLQARKWNSKKIKEILNETYKIELKIKSTSQITQNLLIKKLLVDICCLANAS